MTLALMFGPMLLGGGGSSSTNPLSAITNLFSPFSGSASPPPTTGGGAGPLSIISSLFGGGLGGITNLFSGPGAGEIRRKGARDLVAKTPGLARLKDAIQASGARQVDQILTFLASYLPRDAEARKALGQVVARAQQLGGMGKAYGEEANALGDVVKWVTLSETVTKRSAPNLQQLIAVLGGGGTTTTPPAAYAPQPYGAPAVLPYTAPRTSGSYWANMGTAYSPRAFSSLASYVGGY